MKDQEPMAGQVKSDRTLFNVIAELHELREAGVTELAESLDLPKSTVHKHLKSLVQSGYAVNNDGKYRLSFQFLTLGGAVRNSSRICSYAVDFVRELADESNQLVTFAIKEQYRGFFTYLFNDKYDLEAAHTGKQFYLHQNAAGKAMLSTMPDDTVDEIISQCGLPSETENTIGDRKSLFEELETIRDKGYAVSIEEREEGVQSISAAVEDPVADEIGALSISGPIDRSNDRLRAQYADTVMTSANELELKLRLHE